MNKLNVFNNYYLPMKYPINWGRNIKLFIRSIKYAFQRATKGYCDTDVWDLDKFYLHLLQSSLTELKDISHGYPKDCISPEEWKDCLNEIIQCFPNADFDNYEDKYDECGVTWIDEYTTINKLCKDNLHTGFELLEKHFHDLWD